MGSLAKVATARTKQSTGKKQTLMAVPGALHVLLVYLLVVGNISSKPYFDLGTSYEDMMRSVGRSQRDMSDSFSNVRRGVEGLGREAEELGGRFASDMDDELDQLGARFGQIGHGLGDQFDLLGGHLDNLGQGLNRQFEQDFSEKRKLLSRLSAPISCKAPSAVTLSPRCRV